jgi:Tfp pilus assembly protein PilO
VNALSPRIRFFAIVGISVIVIVGFGWYNYGILSEINNAEDVISGLDKEIRGQGQVRQNILDTQTRREDIISGLDNNVIRSSQEYELAAVVIRDLAKKYDIGVLHLNLRSNDTFPPLNQYTKVKQVPLKRYRIDLRLNGEFLDIGPFFDAVQTQIKSVNLHSYKFSLDPNAAKKVIADVVYYTYRMDRES